MSADQVEQALAEVEFREQVILQLAIFASAHCFKGEANICTGARADIN